MILSEKSRLQILGGSKVYFTDIDSFCKSEKDVNRIISILNVQEERLSRNLNNALANKDNININFYEFLLKGLGERHKYYKSICNQELELKMLREVANTEAVKSAVNNGLHSKQNFEKIALKSTIEQKFEWFLALEKTTNPRNDRPLMWRGETKKLVIQNFLPGNETSQWNYFDLNIGQRQKGTFLYYMQQFYLRYADRINESKIPYGEFIVRNFYPFKDDDPGQICSNMGLSKRRKFYIPVERFIKD